MITAEFARMALDYNQCTGVFTWKAGRKFSGKSAGSINSCGYKRIWIGNREFFAHRLAWLIVTGEWPKDEIDHINGVPGDNRWSNLREASRKQNQQNRRIHKSNRSGYKGVFKNRSGTTWSAQVYSDGKKIHVGCFQTAHEAHEAYKIASENLYREFSNTGTES